MDKDDLDVFNGYNSDALRVVLNSTTKLGNI